MIQFLLAGSLALNAGIFITWSVNGTVELRDGGEETLQQFVDSNAASSPSKGEPAPPAMVTDAVPPQPRQFQWAHDIDAPDFPTFVKNLRAIGCPEATIRDILAGELGEIYAARRSDLQNRSSFDPHLSKDVLERQFSDLALEEAGLLDSLLSRNAKGPASDSVSTALAATHANQSRLVNPAGEVASGSTSASTLSSTESTAALASVTSMVPVAFKVGNNAAEPAVTGQLSTEPTDPNLDPQTSNVIRDIREKFAEGMATAGPDPSSSLYRQRWLLEQRRADERFSSLYGGDLFVRLQIEAAQKTYQASQQETASQNP